MSKITFAEDAWQEYVYRQTQDKNADNKMITLAHINKAL